MDISARLQEAAVEMLAADDHLGDRSKVIGASEVGRCSRLVVHQKLNGNDFDAKGAGRMLAGKALENTVVQLCRRVFDGVKATGRKQVELRHETAPLVCHPDGLMPDACLEIKTAGMGAFRKYKDGLPIFYEDQACIQAGLSGKPATLLVLVNRDSISDVQTFHIPYHETRYQELVSRAERMAGFVASSTLPDGEPERGVCRSCPIRQDCGSFTLALAEAKAGELPLPVLLEAEALIEELRQLQDPRCDEDIAREKAAKDELKELLAPTGFREGPLAGVAVKLIEAKGRVTVDSTGLKKDLPEVYAKYSKQSAASVRLDIQWENA